MSSAPTETPTRPRPTGDPRSARSSYRGLRVVGVVITLLLVLGGATSTAPEMLRQQGTDEMALPSGMTALTLEAPRGDVEVREVLAGESPRLESRSTWTMSRPEVVTTEGEDGTVRAEAPCSGGNLGVCSVDLVAWVPAGTDVQVSTGFGDVDVTTSGAVVVEGTGGNITVDGSPTEASLSATLGDVDFRSSVAPDRVRIRSTLGAVAVQVPAEAYAVSTDSSQGSVSIDPDVRRDADAPHTLDIETTLGDIDIDAE